MDQLKKYITFLSWFPLRSDYLREDIVAGITVALVLIPQSMAYAQLAGLPPYFGLYAAFLPVMLAAMFGSSKQLATGPVAVVSLLTASALIPLVGGYDTMTPAEIAGAYAPLAILRAFLVGRVQLFLGIFKLGIIVNFLSHPVIVGFTNAAAMIIGLSQLNKIFGVEKVRSEHFINDIIGVLQQIPEHTHLPTLMFGIAAIIILWGFKRYIPKIPGVLIAVASLTTISYLIGFEQMGGSVVGIIPEGLPDLALQNIAHLPPFQVPDGKGGMEFSWMKMFRVMLPTAIVISLVGFMEAISIAKAMAARTKDKIDPNQELIGQGIGNIVGSLGQSYPTSGSFSRSAVNIDAGAKTGMSSVITALVVLITLLFLTPMLYHLPSAVLAAVIMMAVIGLINFGAVRHAWKACRHDGVASMVTFVATLGFAPHLEAGIMVGAGLAIGLYLYRSMKPRVAHLGRYDDGTLRDLQIHPNLPTDERIIVVRFDGSLYFANVSYFEETILGAYAEKPNASYVLVVGDGINQLDASGEEVLHHINQRLRDNGVTLLMSGLKRQVLEVMRHTSLFDRISQDNIFATEDMAIADIYRRIGGEGAFCPLSPNQPAPQVA